MKKLPIGIQSFEKMRTDNYTYVDKTPFVKKFEGGGYFFLSRPRRFGKSLFLDTLHQAFSGKRELFEGLYLQDNWDWDKKYPVIHISFGSGVSKSPKETIENIFFQLKLNERFLGIECTERDSYKNCFYELILKANEKYQEKVVVLVD
ncbi:MAG TPA: AAA family ATPase, partial [Spirochaetota bacterium]|nr:AAA family ATPase [Spirochaetota bacterium]